MPQPQGWPVSLNSPEARLNLLGSVANDRRSGVKPSVLSDELQQSYGLSVAQAAELLDDAQHFHAYVNRPTRGRGSARLKHGAVWLVLGLVFSYASYVGALASAGNGRYLVATGAILWGAYSVLRGLSELASASE